MTAIALAIVVVGLAGIGAAWHVAIRLLDRRLVIAGEAKLREEMAALGARIGEVDAVQQQFEGAVSAQNNETYRRLEAAEALAKKVDDHQRGERVGKALGRT